MSNEIPDDVAKKIQQGDKKLAVQIQQGKLYLIPALWARMSRLIDWKAYYFMQGRKAFCDAAGVTLDDLKQAGYLALLDAIKAYDPDSGYKFTAYLTFPLKNRFNEAVGHRRKKREPLNNCTSLDTPIGEGGDTALVDIMPDKNAGAAFEACEHDLYTQELRTALDECLDTLPIQQQDVIRRHYFDGETLEIIADAYGVSTQRIQAIESSGLRKLYYRPQTHRKLAPFLPSYYQFRHEDKPTTTYYASGYGRFRDSGYSSVELAVMCHMPAKNKGGSDYAN